MVCLTSARYTMTAEIYDETVVQKDSGAISRSWDYDNPSTTVDCQAHGIVDGGIRVAGSTERWEGKYQNVEWVHVSCGIRVSKRQRIGKIKSRTGNELYPNLVFDVLGCTPITDPFGQIIEYDILAARAEVL